MGKATISILASMLAVAVAAIALAPAAALAGQGDVASTKAYIQANYTLVHTARGNIKTGEAAIASLRRQLSAECPKAAAASPENEAAEQLSNEVVGAMSVIFIRSDVHAIADFAHTVGRLHWSNQNLTRKVAAYAAKLTALAAIATPNVCGDVKAWASGDYRTLPTSTAQFERQFKAEDVGIGEVPAPLLAPYENPGERSTLGRSKQFENELVDAEARAVTTWSKILNALDLQP